VQHGPTACPRTTTRGFSQYVAAFLSSWSTASDDRLAYRARTRRRSSTWHSRTDVDARGSTGDEPRRRERLGNLSARRCRRAIKRQLSVACRDSLSLSLSGWCCAPFGRGHRYADTVVRLRWRGRSRRGSRADSGCAGHRERCREALRSSAQERVRGCPASGPVSDALRREQLLLGVPIIATARAPLWRGSPATIEVAGQVPSPQARETALRIVRAEASRIRADVQIEDRLAVVPRHAA
jgi:hypothetical protein